MNLLYWIYRKIFYGLLVNFGQFTVYNAGSDNSITAFVFKASLADLCNSPLKNGITSTAAKRTKKKTWKTKKYSNFNCNSDIFIDRELHSYGSRICWKSAKFNPKCCRLQINLCPKVRRILKRILKGLWQSGKNLPTFEFWQEVAWRELAWLGAKCKGKTLLVILTLHRDLHAHSPVLMFSIQSKT